MSSSNMIQHLSGMWLFVGVYLGVLAAAGMLVSRPRSSNGGSTTGALTATDTNNDDSWKRGLYTNRTLHRDQDPLHVTWKHDDLGLNCTPSPYHRQLELFECCDDCSIQQQRGIQSAAPLDVLEVLAELIMLLEMQDEVFNNPCLQDQQVPAENGVDTSCVIAPYSWKL